MPYTYTLAAIPGAPDSTAPIPLAPVGRWMRPLGIDLNSTGANTLVTRHALANHIEYIPFTPQYDMSFDSIGFQYVSLNSCTDTWYYTIGLYSSLDKYPATKLLDCGTLSIDPASPPPSPRKELTLGSAQALVGGTTYWLATGITVSGGTDQAASRTPILGQLFGDYANIHTKGMSNTGVNADGLAFFEQLGSFGGSLPSSTSFSNCAASNGAAIRLALKRSA